MCAIPIGYYNNDNGLIVLVRITKRIKVICKCSFKTEQAYPIHVDKYYNASLHSSKLQDAIRSLGFDLISVDEIAYANWLFGALKFSNRI